jgi:hypothetical protein
MSEGPFAIPPNDGQPVMNTPQVAPPAYPDSSPVGYATAPGGSLPTQPAYLPAAQPGQALAAYPAYAAPAQPVYAPGIPGAPNQVPVARGLLVKRRNPFAVWLGLPLITLGIYSLVWYYKVHHEMGEFDRRRNVPDIGPVLVLIFLGWTFIAPLISLYNCGGRIANAQRAAGLRASCSGGVGVLLMFVFGLGTLYYQAELNRVHDAYGQHTEPGTDVPLFA